MSDELTKTTTSIRAVVSLDACLEAIADLIPKSRPDELAKYQADCLRCFASDIEQKLTKVQS